jgi:hypothetical protein
LPAGPAFAGEYDAANTGGTVLDVLAAVPGVAATGLADAGLAADVLVSDVPVADVPVADVLVADVPVADVLVAGVPLAQPAAIATTPLARTAATPRPAFGKYLMSLRRPDVLRRCLRTAGF